MNITQEELQEKPRIWVPSSAIVTEGDGAHVVVVNTRKQASIRRVTVGRTHEGRVEVVSGLSEGDKIIIKEPASYHDNQTVRIAAP